MGWMIYTGILSALLLGLIAAGRVQIEDDWKPEMMYRLFLRPAVWLTGQLDRRFGVRGRESPAEIRIMEEMRLLYASEARKKRYRYQAERISAFLCLCFAGTLLALAVTVAGEMNRRLTEEGWVRRNSYGEGSAQLLLEAEADGRSSRLQIEVEERKYTDSELEEMLPGLRMALEEELRGENVSLDEIRTSVHLPRQMAGYPFSITWESGNYGRIRSDGTVNTGGIPEEGELVELRAVLSCYGENRTEYFTVRVRPPLLSGEEELQALLLETLSREDVLAAHQEGFYLPGQADGMEVTWKERIPDGGPGLLLIFLLAGLLQLGMPDGELKKRMVQREQELLTGYPEFISRLVLFMGAGLPARAAFARMASDYAGRRSRGGGGYLCEELLLVCREMENGMTEMQAYEHFGQRCRLPQYRKCMTLLVQNLKKGSGGLLAALQEEAADSFEIRKHRAREEGERAGTRLLFPMLLMLLVVMVLIMVPACLSFAGM